MPDNIVEVAETMIDRGVEQGRPRLCARAGDDQSTGDASMGGCRSQLLERLLTAGATPTAAGHRRDAGALASSRRSRRCCEAGHADDGADRRRAWPHRSSWQRCCARRRPRTIAERVRHGGHQPADSKRRGCALDAGADVNGFLPVHAHSTALHQAAIDENLELIELLIARGARADIADTLWGSTPLGWAMHQGKARARAYLEGLRQQS